MDFGVVDTDSQSAKISESEVCTMGFMIVYLILPQSLVNQTPSIQIMSYMSLQ